MKRVPVVVINLMLILASILLSLSLIEVTLYCFFATGNLGRLPKNLGKSIYHHMRSIVQYEPECAQYDKKLGYILKRNAECNFNNYEFSTHMQINSMGVRDSELALKAHDTIFIGDSYTMGWGAEQQEAFPQQVAAMTGLSTLNAGISSYGTAREMMLLQSLITRDTRRIVLQYSVNDYEENEEYVKAGYTLKVSPEREYIKRSSRLRYYPGKYCEIIFYHIRGNIRTILARGKEPFPRKLEAQYMLRVLANHSNLLNGRRLTILACPADKEFLSLVRQELPSFKELRGIEIDFLDTSSLLTSADEYEFDDHYKPSGYNKIAKLISSRLLSSSEEGF